MKKIFVAALVALSLMILCSCGKTAPAGTGGAGGPSSSRDGTETPTGQPASVAPAVSGTDVPPVVSVSPTDAGK